MQKTKVLSVHASQRGNTFKTVLFIIFVILTGIHFLVNSIVSFGSLILLGVYFKIFLHWYAKHEIPKGKTLFGIALVTLFIITGIKLYAQH